MPIINMYKFLVCINIGSRLVINCVQSYDIFLEWRISCLWKRCKQGKSRKYYKSANYRKHHFIPYGKMQLKVWKEWGFPFMLPACHCCSCRYVNWFSTLHTTKEKIRATRATLAFILLVNRWFLGAGLLKMELLCCTNGTTLVLPSVSKNVNMREWHVNGT